MCGVARNELLFHILSTFATGVTFPPAFTPSDANTFRDIHRQWMLEFALRHACQYNGILLNRGHLPTYLF